jgi:hypothetical protein
MVATTALRRTEIINARRNTVSIRNAGLLVMLLGAWSGIVSFVGPTFGFSADGTGSWDWNLAHGLLFLVPGAAAFVAGLVLMLGDRSLRGMAGLLAALSGAWLVVGPLAWRVLEGSTFFVGASPLRSLAYWVGYSLGPGALLIGFGAFALGRATPVPLTRQVHTAATIDTSRPASSEQIAS